MGMFGRLMRRGSRGNKGGVSTVDRQHLADWTQSHIGVEAYVEPETTVTPVTVVLVASDGEWTRRAVGGDKGARKLGEDLKIPVYDVRKVGYPQRMRDHDARQKIIRRREQGL
ncbi:oxidoreductase [Rhodococcoides trifolii]